MKNYFKKTLIFLAFSVFLPANAGILWNLQDGINFYNRADYKNAKDFFINYSANNPNDSEGYYQLARTYLKLKDNTSAVNNFEKAYDIEANKSNLAKIVFKTDIQTINDYFDMAVMYFEEANLQEANFYADLILKMDSKNSNGWFLKAKIAKSQGKKEEATEYLKKAILYNNKLLKTNLAKKLNIYSIPQATKEQYYLFAFEDYYKGNIESSVYNCQKYLEADSLNPDINILLIKLYLLKNDYEQALKVLQTIEKTSDNIGIYLLKAKIYENKGNLSEQEKILNKAYKINPNNSEMLYNIGNYYLKKEDNKSALKYFEALINTDDGYYEGYFGYIKSLIETGKINKSLGYIRKANTLNPLQSEINYLLALVCYKQGQFSAAKDYIEEAILKHKNSNYYLLKAKILYYSGEYAQSLNALNEMPKLSQTVYKSSEVDKFYAKNYIKLKNLQSLQYYMNSSDFELDKSSPLYKYILYKIYKTEGNDKKADFLYGQIKFQKPNSTGEYLDLSEIVYEEEGLDNSIKLLNKAIGKMPDESELYSQKIKIYSISRSFEKAKETLEEMSEKFN